MNYELRDLVNKVIVKHASDKDATHMYYGGNNNQKITVDNQHMTTFWDNYCRIIQEDNSNVHLAELPTKEIPLMQEFIFKFQIEDMDMDDWNPYDDSLISSIVQLYQQTLRSHYHIYDDNQYIVAVLESSNYWLEEEDVACMALKVHFPNTKIAVSNQDTFIRKEIIAQLRKKNILSKFHLSPIGDWDVIMSKGHKSAPIHLYGSSPKVNGKVLPPLKLLHLWGKMETEDDNEEMLELETEDVFDINKHTHVYNSIVNIEIFKKEININHWLPMFLSIHYCSNVQLAKDMKDKKVVKSVEPIRQFGEKKPEDYVPLDGIELAIKMLDMVSQKRFLQEAFWLDIGRALYNVDHKEGLVLWIRYTTTAANGIQLLPNFFLVHGNLNKHKMSNNEIITAACENKFDTFAQSHLTTKTLAFYAREDNDVIYREWHKSWCVDAMENALNGSEVDLAEALYRIYWLDYVYDPSINKWFIFKQYGWEETSKGILLRKDISSKFLKKFDRIHSELSTQRRNDNAGNNADVTLKKLNAIIMSLKKNPMKNKIMMEAQEFFEIDRFSTFLDKNHELTGVKNGVLEIIGKNIVFRKAKPEDFISMCAGVPYHDYFHWNHPLVLECMKWFGQTFEEDLVEHFLKFGSSGFIRRNCDKIFPIFTGCGNNSKSMIIKLFMITFGMYAIKISVAVLFEKSLNSANASPQLARTKNCMWAFADESDDAMSMNKAAIKRYTGGDSFFSRKLNENGEDIELTIKLIMSANNIPNISDPDEAIKNRVKIIPFGSVWCANAPESEEEQMRTRTFKMDPDFEKRIPILASAFLWILVQYFPKYCKYGLKDPQSVIDYTREYWSNNDIYGKFVNDNVKEAYISEGERDMNSKVTMNQLYTEFKTWFRSSYPQDRLPNRDVVRADFIKRWGRSGSDGWPGLYLPQSNFDILPINPTF